MQNQCLWQSTPSPVCYLARMQGDTWGSAGGGRWKWEVSLTSTADSCSWISKNSCERWQVLIIFYSLSQSSETHCNYVVLHSVKFCHRRSLAARKEKLNHTDSPARALVSHKRKNVFLVWLFSSVCFLFLFFPPTADRCRKDMFGVYQWKNSFLHSSLWKNLRGRERDREREINGWRLSLAPWQHGVASLLSSALAVYLPGNAWGNKWCSSRLRHEGQR